MPEWKSWFNRFAYVANLSDGTISGYTINCGTGALTSMGAAFTADSGSDGEAVDPSGRFLYVTNCGPFSGTQCLSGSGNDISAFSIGPTSGALTSIAQYSLKTARAVAVEPTGRFAYALDRDDGTISAYSINVISGALSLVQSVALGVGTSPRSAAIDPSGKFLYIANFGVSNFTSTVSAYTIDPVTGFLTAISGSPFAAGVNPIAVAVDPSGRFAYVANNGGGNITAYSINASSGALTQIGTPVNSGSRPDFISVDPSDKFVYVSNLFGSMTSDIFAFKIQSNGSLVGVAGSPFAGGNLPSSVVTIGVIH